MPAAALVSEASLRWFESGGGHQIKRERQGESCGALFIGAQFELAT
jgi:hypothetical protein